MRRVALVQNQSEMRHNAYSDSRHFFDAELTTVPELGCKLTLFTADNIGTLASELELNRFDAVVLGSNSLVDRAIQDAFREPVLIEALDGHLARGRGLVCFHQLNFARSGDPSLRFLPKSLGSVRVLPASGAGREIAVAAGAASHVALLYPNTVDVKDLNRAAKENENLVGAYWHTWSEFDAANWDVLLEDPRNERLALLLVGRRARVVLCAQPLDWQRHAKLALNLIVYTTQGPPSTAVIRAKDRRDAEPRFIEGWLEGERFPYSAYETNNLARLREYVESGVHTTVLLQPGIELHHLEQTTRELLVGRMSESTLRVIGFGEPVEGVQALWTAGEQFESITWLRWVRGLAMDDLRREGRTDDSFWSTIETLEALKELGEISTPPMTEADLEPLVRRVLERIAPLTQDNTYDQTFAATCGLLRLRHEHDARGARRTERWLRDRLGGKLGTDELLAYTTFARTGRLRVRERRQLVERLQADEPPRTELEALRMLAAAREVGAVECLPRLVGHVVAHLDETRSRWVDLSTTAGAIVSLLAARSAIDKAHVDGKGVKLDADAAADLENALLKATLYVRSAADEKRPYPWDGKASTSLRCLFALVVYNQTLDVPVIDAIEVVRRGDRFSRQRAASDAAGEVLTVLRTTKERLASELGTANEKAGKAERLRVQRNRVVLGLVVVSYVAAFLLIGAASDDTNGTPASLGTLLADTFDKYRDLHLGVLAVFGAAVLTLTLRGAFGSLHQTDRADDASGDAA